MNKFDKLENEYIKAIDNNPCNASLYNDYAVFLNKYKRDFYNSAKYLTRAIRLEPNNYIYKSNLNKIIKKHNNKNHIRYIIFALFILGIILWIACNGYSNFVNTISLFLLAQIVLHARSGFRYINEKNL